MENLQRVDDMGQDEVWYMNRMLGLTIEEIYAMESGCFYWLFETLLAQEIEEEDINADAF